MQDTTTAQAMQHRADLIEKLNAAGVRPQMTRQMTTGQLEDFLAWSEGTGGPWEDDKPYSGTAPIERGPFPGMIWP